MARVKTITITGNAPRMKFISVPLHDNTVNVRLIDQIVSPRIAVVNFQSRSVRYSNTRQTPNVTRKNCLLFLRLPSRSSSETITGAPAN